MYVRSRTNKYPIQSESQRAHRIRYRYNHQSLISLRRIHHYDRKWRYDTKVEGCRTYNGTCYNTAITRDVVQQITDDSIHSNRIESNRIESNRIEIFLFRICGLSLSLTRNCSDDFGHHNHITTYSYGLASLFFSQAQRNIKGSSFSVEASSPMITASSSSSPSSSILDFLDL